mmetsp:Transcript_85216/g.127697  ORF Transcript_85216/g.127697 Transcript_85216/m.127697 type:complete len:265 (+) Transcript_85216:189-983(+)
MQEINIIGLQPNLKNGIFFPSMCDDTSLHEHLLTKCCHHLGRNLLRDFKVFVKGATRDYHMASELSFELFGLSIGVFEVFPHKLTISLGFIGSFFFPFFQIFLRVFKGRQVGMLRIFKKWTKHIVLISEAVVVEILAIPFWIVYFVHPVFKSRHLDFIFVEVFKTDDTRLHRCLVRDFGVAKSQVVAFQLLHIRILDVNPGEVKVAISRHLVSFIGHQLRVPMLEEDGGLRVVLHSCEDEIRNVKVQIVYKPPRAVVGRTADLK